MLKIKRRNVFKLPKLKLYQQIILCFTLIALIPLTGVSVIIYTINQTALKKELSRFTHHTTDAIYKELETEMSWQQNEIRMMASYFRDAYGGKRKFESAAQGVFRLSEPYEAVGLYTPEGKISQSAYRNYSHLSPEIRLPLEINPKQRMENPYQVLYINAGNPEDSTYYLQALIPPNSTPGAGYLMILKRFDYMQNLIRSTQQTLYDGMYIFDSTGQIIAGPSRILGGKHFINAEDFKEFQALPSGVTRMISTTAPTVEDTQQPKIDDEKEKDPPDIQKVFVKMPNINWGIIVESPYAVQQTYVKRARLQSILLVIACIGVILGLGLFYILGINRNFRQLIKAIKAMEKGNYSRRIRLITNTTTPYEIIYVAVEFNRMARRMAESWESIQKLNAELVEANNKLAKLDEIKSNLIDTVSHELRTPLTSIKGYTSRLLRYDDTLDNETRVKSLKVVKQQADRLGRLVEDLLVIPDLENEKLRVFPDRVGLYDLLERSAQFIQDRTQRDISLVFADNLPVSPEELDILADPDRFEQVMLNLFDNAVKYSYPDTPITVEIRLSDGLSPSSLIEVTVSNSCDPIPAEMLDSLFEKFKRLDDSMTRTTRGSGLGLFITKGLIEAMGGKIHLSYSDVRFHVHVSVPLYTDAAVATELSPSI